MEKKTYIPKEFFVLNEFIKKPLHIREVSRKTNINPMTIKKIVDEFLGKNILGFRKEGKNKVFFLKRNFESKNLKIIYETYLRIDLIRKNPLMRDIFEKISNNKKIKLAILFGSYAKGLEHDRSDIDIYLKTKNLNLKKEIELINSKISVKIGDLKEDDFLTKEIHLNHIIIKGVEEYYEK